MKKQAIKEVEHWGNIIWYYFLYNVINDNNYHKEYKIYKNNKLPKNVKDRCCNFPLLEEKCRNFSDVTNVII